MNKLTKLFFLTWSNLEQQFIMDLNEHPGRKITVVKTILDIEHSHFDDVCGTSLDWSIQCGTLSHITARPIC